MKELLQNNTPNQKSHERTTKNNTLNYIISQADPARQPRRA